MQISGLQASGTFTASDVLAIEINGKTYKLTGGTLASALQTIGGFLTGEDVVNSLNSTDPTKALAAPQGKALSEAIAQSTALLMGEQIQLESSAVLIPNNITTKVFSEASFNSYKFVDLYFEFQGGRIPAMRLFTNYGERKFKAGFFAFNDGDGELRKCVLTFTTNGRYVDNVVVKVANGDNGAFGNNTTSLYLVAAVGYKW